MKRFVIYFLILLASIWVGIKIHKDPGYVLITYQHWSLETTLWFAILAVVVFFLVLYFLMRMLRGTSAVSQKFNMWLEERRSRKANKYTYRGLCELAEGEWQSAEKNLIRGAAHSEMPLVNYLAAAEAAQKRGHFEERDNYLRQAHDNSPQAEIAIGLTQAQLQLNAKQWELALATLRHLHQLVPNQAYVLKLLKTVYLELNDWKHLKELYPELLKYKVRKYEDLEKLEQQIYLELLKSAVNSGNINTVNETWEETPKQLQSQPALLLLYVDFLLKHDDDSKAETLLRDAIKKNWNPYLVARYGLAKGDNPEKQLATAENWLKNHNDDPALLLCLGRLCIRNHLLDKARDYLWNSAQLEPRAETYRELGQLYEQLNEPQKAIESYRKGLQFC